MEDGNNYLFGSKEKPVYDHINVFKYRSGEYKNMHGLYREKNNILDILSLGDNRTIKFLNLIWPIGFPIDADNCIIKVEGSDSSVGNNGTLNDVSYYRTPS